MKSNRPKGKQLIMSVMVLACVALVMLWPRWRDELRGQDYGYGRIIITSGTVNREDAVDIVKNPIVQAALNQAWNDSLPDELEARHEEGGWIIQNSAGGLRIQRCPSGAVPAPDSTDMTMVVCDAKVGPNEQPAAFFHTHPGPEVDENGNRWQNDPSTDDREAVPPENESDPPQFGVVRTENNDIIYDHTYDD
jgi:hypothetical protein